MKKSDGPSVLEIYADGLKTRMATFETTMPTWDQLDQKWHKNSRFVYEQEGQVVGWVALNPVSNREVMTPSVWSTLSIAEKEDTYLRTVEAGVYEAERRIAEIQRQALEEKTAVGVLEKGIDIPIWALIPIFGIGLALLLFAKRKKK